VKIIYGALNHCPSAIVIRQNGYGIPKPPAPALAQMDLEDVMQTLLNRSLMWLFAEVILTLLNLDDLADYGEFIFRIQDSLTLQRERIEFILLTGKPGHCQPCKASYPLASALT
jgi:hypothetical protein